jgi:hypothetical protein
MILSENRFALFRIMLESSIKLIGTVSVTRWSFGTVKDRRQRLGEVQQDQGVARAGHPREAAEMPDISVRVGRRRLDEMVMPVLNVAVSGLVQGLEPEPNETIPFGHRFRGVVVATQQSVPFKQADANVIAPEPAWSAGRIRWDLTEHLADGALQPFDRASGRHGAPVYAPYVEHVPPDVTACIFWLKNRDPAHWRDAWQVDHTLGKYIISDKPMTEEEWIAARADVIDVTPEKPKE